MTEGGTSLVKCHVCGGELDKENVIEEEGLIFCEGCYIENHHKIQACNPRAVRLKKYLGKKLGLKGQKA